MAKTPHVPLTLEQASAALAHAGYSVRPLADSTAVIATLRRGELWASVVLDPDTAVPAVALRRTTPGAPAAVAARLFERDSRRVAGRSVPYTLANAVGHGLALARQLDAGVRR